MDNKERKYVFIYNPMQSEFYFNRGIIPVTTGTGSKGDPYVKFINSEEVQTAFNDWCTRIH
jgi:hypothetical protein